MNNAEFQLRGVGDPRLAVHATSAFPAWLWSLDGTRILWANPVGARLFGAADGAALAQKPFGPADARRRQVAQLSGRLPLGGAIRLERLRGFGSALGMLVTCGCARLEFADGNHGILIAAAEPVGRAMPLLERLQLLVEGVEQPIAAFARDGMLVGASDAAAPLFGFRNLSEAGLDEARDNALRQGWVETTVGLGRMVLQRVGSGADVGLVGLIAPAVPQATKSGSEPIAPAVEQPMPDYEQPAISGEAPAEFVLVDEFADEPSAETTEPAHAEPAPEAVAPAAEQPMPDYEQPAISGEAPAEFALVDEFADETPVATMDAPQAEPTPEPVAPAAEQPMPDYEQPANSGEAPAEFALIEEGSEQTAEPPMRIRQANSTCPMWKHLPPRPRPPRRRSATAAPPASHHPMSKPLPTSRRRCPPKSRHGATSPRPPSAATRCASCGRWMPTAVFQSAPTNSSA